MKAAGVLVAVLAAAVVVRYHRRARGAWIRAVHAVRNEPVVILRPGGALIGAEVHGRVKMDGDHTLISHSTIYGTR